MLRLIFWEFPDDRNVPTRNHQSVPEHSKLGREEGNSLLVPIHLMHIPVARSAITQNGQFRSATKGEPCPVLATIGDYLKASYKSPLCQCSE